MEVKVKRFISDEESTLGRFYINGEKVCFTLEDEKRTVKVPGETRIPAGRFQIKYREVLSKKTEQYRAKYPWFKWHLELQNVPDFMYVYIHVGNYEKDSDGCILVGMGYKINDNGADMITQSVAAFEKIYKAISAALDAGEEVWITIEDE